MQNTCKESYVQNNQQIKVTMELLAIKQTKNKLHCCNYCILHAFSVPSILHMFTSAPHHNHVRELLLLHFHRERYQSSQRAHNLTITVCWLRGKSRFKYSSDSKLTLKSVSSTHTALKDTNITFNNITLWK